jgi:hypothetical protein
MTEYNLSNLPTFDTRPFKRGFGRNSTQFNRGCCRQ